MQINDCVDSLITLEAHGAIHSTTATEIFSKLILLEAYPENIIIPGEADFAIASRRYGDAVMSQLMEHLCKSLRGNADITEVCYLPYLPQRVCQDPTIASMIYAMYERTRFDLHSLNFEYFPYEFSRIGKTSVLLSQLRGERLLEFAGL